MMKSTNFFVLITVFILISIRIMGHPMPHSILLLDLKSKGISADLQLPLPELQLAFGKDIYNTDNLIRGYRKELSNYILTHIRIDSEDGTKWEVKILDMQTGDSEQTATGVYKELIVHLWMQPLKPTNIRKFILNYDVIIHQVVTHKILVSVRQDWINGIVEEKQTQVGIIALDTRKNIVPPLSINLEGGSLWKGFKSMVTLGMQHISEGTDHLLFLLVLLLSAPLIAENKRWGKSGGIKYSIIRLTKVATAFTIGHSLTLIAGAMNWLQLPQQPVEVMIAISILVTAFHALRPIFPEKEIFIAGGFGLIHGLAFATIISDLQLNTGEMALSILGFNIGIELMQLFVIIISMPWLIILSRTPMYTSVRIIGGVLAAIASLGWIAERLFDESNMLTSTTEMLAEQTPWLLLVLASTALLSLILQRMKKRLT